MIFRNAFNLTPDQSLNRSLRNSLLAALPGTAFFSIIQGSAYTAFVRALNNYDSFYGLLAAIPLIAGIFRLLSAYLLERFHARRKLFFISLYAQRLSWIPFALIPYFIPGTSPGLRSVIAVLCLGMHGIGGSLGDVAFLSWIMDLVPHEMYGSFLGFRNRLAQIAVILTPLAVGWYLDGHPGFTGLSTVLIAAALLGVLDISLWHGVSHPPEITCRQPMSLRRMIMEPLKLPSYRKLLFFWTSTLFAFGLMSPFLMVYNLEVLKLSNTQSSLQLQVLPGLMAFLLARVWGRSVDRFGSKPLLKFCMALSSTFPVFWIFSTASYPWAQFIPNILGGAIWVGLDIAQTRLMMKILPQENRSVYIAGYGLTAWLGGNAAAAMLAGYLADLIRPWVDSCRILILNSPLTAYQVLFLISAIFRLVIFLFIIPRIEEPSARSTRELITSFQEPIRKKRGNRVAKGA